MRFFKTIILLFFLFGLSKGFSQDLNLTQYYASPLLLNPAFAGAVEQYRFTTTYRNQWVQVPKSFSSNLASFDYNLINYNSGLGVFIFSDRLPAFSMSKTHISLSYSYAIFTGTDWVIRLGLQGGYTQQRRDLTGLQFGDQLLTGAPTLESVNNLNAGILDLSTGIVMYNAKTWFGLAAYHVHRPTVSETSIALPMRISAHFGTTLKFKGRDLLPSVLYQAQAGFQQLDMGANYVLDPLIVGLWYRGIPFQADESGLNQDAIAALVGINIKDFTVSYSYDYNISPISGAPGGSHEISIVYMPPASRKFKQSYNGKQYIQCPTFKTR